MNKYLNFVIFGTIGTVFIMDGCSMAPKYTRPKAPVPSEWPRGKAYQAGRAVQKAPEVQEIDWPDFFTDKRLKKLIETALKNNRDLRLAALNVERARRQYGVQRAELFPAPVAVGSGTKQRLPAESYFTRNSMKIKQYSVNLGVTSWEIDFFGRIRSLKDQALEEYLATEEARRSAQIALISEVARVFLTLAADRASLKLARSTLDNQQGVYDLVKRQYETGLANELDLHRAKAQVDAARSDVANYFRLVAQDKNALDLLAGSPVSDQLLPADLDDVSSPMNFSPGLSSEVLLRRPDIMAAEHQLRAVYAFIGAARAAFFPRISLTTMVGTLSDELSGLFKPGSRTWNFSPEIVMPVFDARTWAALRVSKTMRQIALTRYEKAIQTAFREVADSLAVRGTIDQQVSAQESLVNALAKTYHLSSKRYIDGIDSYLGVLDAQRSLYAGQLGLIRLRLARLANQVRLYAVLGGGGGKPGAN